MNVIDSHKNQAEEAPKESELRKSINTKYIGRDNAGGDLGGAKRQMPALPLSFQVFAYIVHSQVPILLLQTHLSTRSLSLTLQSRR